MSGGLSWLSIVRLGFVQTALGAIIVLMTSTLNRVMVVELGLLATIPGALVAFHYAVQMSRPRWGYGSDMGGRRTPWIIGGMVVLALGGILAATATAVMATSFLAGIALAVLAFLAIGVGVGAAGTSLLVLLATQAAPGRRAPAASIVWIMMIVGFAVTAGVAGSFLDPFSLTRLVGVSATVSGIAVLVTVVALWGVEPKTGFASKEPERKEEKPEFGAVLRAVLAEPKARQFTIFVFVSMLAYSGQELILEPFAGLVFGMTPGETTKLTAFQNSGTALGMILVGIAGSSLFGRRIGSLRFWTVGGCAASALCLASLTVAGQVGPGWPLQTSVFCLGVSNGAFAVAAIGSMFSLANEGRGAREGTRMGLWGAAQAIAFALGGFLGTVAVDVMGVLVDGPAIAYGVVFTAEGVLFVVAAALAARIEWSGDEPSRGFMPAAAEGYVAGGQ